jgi:SprA-related family
MQIEQYPGGISTDRPAIVVRNARLVAAARSTLAKVEGVGHLCPKCGKTGLSCCKNDDSLSISGEAYSKYLAEPAQINSADSGNRLKSSDDSVSISKSEFQANDRFSNPIEPVGEENHNHKMSDDESSPHSGFQENGNGSLSSNGNQKDELSGEKKGSGSDKELSESDKKEVEKLKSRDTEVRQHEMAHLAAAGNLASGGASYEYEKGPDGNSYAVGGEVNISVGGGSTPEERISNAEKAERAALAPSEPSSADKQIASEARSMATEARQELADKKSGKSESESENDMSVNKIEEREKESQLSPLKKASNAYSSQSISSSESDSVVSKAKKLTIGRPLGSLVQAYA